MKKTKEFIALKRLWYAKLRDMGFDDIETEDERLYQPDLRTISWSNHEEIRNYFLFMDAYLTHHPDISNRDRQVLESYSAGSYLVDIVKNTGLSQSTIQRIIAKHKAIVLRLMRDC